MGTNLTWRFVIIAIVVGFLGLQAYEGITGKLQLGIDLEGGSEIIFKFDFSDKQPGTRAPLLTEAISIVQDRIDGYGLKELLIQPIGDDRFSVAVPAKEKKNVDAIKNLITVLGRLEFHITVEPSAQNYDAYWKMFQAALDQDVDLDQARTIRTDQLLDGDKEFYPDGLRWYPLSDKRKQEGYSPTRLPAGEEPWVLCRLDQFNITGESLTNVAYRRSSEGFQGGWIVVFGIEKSYQGNMARLTAKEGEFMATILNDKVDIAPVLNSTLSDSAQIQGNFDEEEARSLAAVLQAGALKQKPELISERTVAADLAGGARDRGILSILVGFTLVLVIMVWLYMKPGLLANLALLLNLVLLLGVLTWFDAVLTLPGLAGVVLTVGMAVDANILVFERIKEEKGKGRTVNQAIMTGYDRALVTIIDSNLTTLITAYFLFQIGSGPVRGFGITLAVGIIASMFTALYVTRTLFEFLLRRGVVKEAKMRGEFHPTTVRWMSLVPRAVTISAFAMVVGLVLFDVVPEKQKYDLDFTKGSKLIVRFSEPVQLGDVRERIGDLADTNPLYKDVSVRVSAEGIGASVTGDEGDGFELRSQSIATKQEIDAFVSDLRGAFKDALLPGPLESTIREGEGGHKEGDIYFLSPDVEPALVREAFRQHTARTGTLDGAEVTRTDLETAGAGSVFRIRFGVQDAGSNPSELSLSVRGALSAYDQDEAQLELRGRANDAELSEEERAAAAADLAVIEKFTPAPPDTIFDEADPFPLADRIDPSTAQEHRNAAVQAIALSILGIIIYVAFRFRSWAFGFAAVIALIHDVSVVMGVVAVVNWLGLVDARLNLVTVAAFLTLIGYSINDTIVVFDRIRENRGTGKGRLGLTIDKSINQTFSRTIRTTLTTWVVVLLLFLMNYGQNSSLEGFAFILTVGVLVGTYSSIFIASPTLLFVPWFWERCGSKASKLLIKALPYIVASVIFLLGVDILEGQLGSDPSIAIFNDTMLAIPMGLLAMFLVYFVMFVNRKDAEGIADKSANTA